jgi:F0F1-type ATP synthase assembly protein I
MDRFMPDEKFPPVELDELLAAEFNYIAQTANQANEDRARVSSFYLVAVGSLVAALFGTQLFDTETFTQAVKLMFSGLFVLLTLLGTSTVMQLARLRSAWHESMLAMNQIKDFAMRQNPELAKAFRWKTSTLPPKYKISSVSYYQAVEVALIGGLMFGAAMFFLQQAFFTIGTLNWIICVLLGGLAVYLQLVIYERSLR